MRKLIEIPLMQKYRPQENDGRRKEVFEVLDIFLSQGIKIENMNGYNQFRLNDKLDVYAFRGRIYSLVTKEWISTTPENIINRIEAFLNV